jgi:hypothetical protein
MNRRQIKILSVLPGLCLLLCRCVQTYVSPYVSPATGYLVVEGYMSGNTPSQFTLSRTIPLSGDSTIPVVTGASLQIEGNDNSIYPLTEQGNGIYTVDTLPLSVAVQYRLRINISNGESYLSDFVPYKPTPVIDSINWVDGGGGGVNIYANTHDVTNSTRYYQWQYTQTWQYNSAEASDYIYNPGTNTLSYRLSSQLDYTCWRTSSSTNILIDNSAKLVSDVIYEYPLLNIPANSQQLAEEYSIIVTQSSLTATGYNYLYLMQLNNESLGSVFDVQPSAPVGGNIHALSNSNETVIGYVSAGTIQQQRIFIKRSQLASWLYIYACQQPDIDVPDIPDSLLYYFNYYGYTPIQEVKPGVYSANYPECIDCTWQGGVTTKPSFWPN